MIRFITHTSRWLFSLAVLGTALIAIFLFILGFFIILLAIADSVIHPGVSLVALKASMSLFMQIINVFLVATVFYIIALGFYELFIAKAPLPGWLKICNLEDLKRKLLSLVIIALAVLLLGTGLTWKGGSEILAFGLAVSLGIAAISFYIWVKH